MSRIHAITMPKWGIEMQEGTINGWHATIGQTLGKTEPLLDVETEKIVNTVETPVAGTLRRIIGQVGDTLSVGALIGLMADADVTEEELDRFIGGFKGADASFEPVAAAVAAPAPVAAPTADEAGGEARVSPIARRVAERLGVDISKVVGTGRNGRVSKEDVEAYHASLAAGAASGNAVAAGTAPAVATPAAVGTREKMTSMRLTIARRLGESKQTIPHYRLGVDVDFTALFARRAAMVAGGTKVSVNDLLLQAVAQTLGRHPQLNAHLEGDEVVKFAQVDLSVAVATDGGLTTPVVRNAASLDAAAIGAAVTALAERARTGKLAREDITGGTFTVSNLGMFGIDRFDAIINPPQVGILAVGAARERVIARDGAAVVAKVATLTLSADHRVVDGAVGAAFLADLRTALEAG
jgi:pyruvate dehydrogenase E2 component (dihydrolipoamide acetyltransferase)